MKTQILRLAVTFAMSLTIACSTCQAGPILDWLFPKRASRRAASEVGRMTYRIPLDAYQYNMAGYSPTTSYRSVWAPVPVTQYRPVGYVNPLSTGTQTNMLPCSSQEWQSRRVPYTAYMPSNSLLGGGSGWQSVSQSPLHSFSPLRSPTTVGYPGAQVGFQQPTSSWTPVSPAASPTTTFYGGGVSPIDSGWVPVGSGVSYAAPTGTSGLQTEVRRAGYPELPRVRPLPSAFDGSSDWEPVVSSRQASATETAQTWKPVRNGTTDRDICKNCPADRDSTGADGYGADGYGATPWKAYNGNGSGRGDDAASSRSRTRVTPADESPSLLEGRERYAPQLQRLEPDPYRNESLDPTKTNYRPPSVRDANRNRVRPAITQQEFANRRGRVNPSTYELEPLTKTAPLRTAPYVKPIPNLSRQIETQQPPIQSQLRQSVPKLLDSFDERTARTRQVAPDRRAVPIDWNAVDIDRQGGLTRVKVPSSLTSDPAMIDLTPPQNAPSEGGWRRVR